MEFLNKVELLGIVGSSRESKVGDMTLVRFSVATDYAFNDKYGNAVVETTWHMVSAFSDKITNGPSVNKGDKVFVSGRIRNVRYTTPEGVEKSMSEIVADKVQIIWQ